MEYRVIRTGSEDELYHYGVKGMKWGHRKNVYDINAAYYNKRATKLDAKAKKNRLYANMQRSAAKSGSGLISKANNINANYYQKKADKLSVKADRNRTMAKMNAEASKQRGEAKAKKLLDKRGKTKASAGYIAMEAAHGYEAARSLLNGNVAGAIGYGRRYKAYRDNRKYWEDM